MTRIRSASRQPIGIPDHEPAVERTRTGGRDTHTMRRTRSKRGQAGATVLEYAILIAVLAGAAIAAATVLGDNLETMITGIAGRIPALIAGIGGT